MQVQSDGLLAQRLVNQQMVRPRLRTPQELVAWMGAIQAQEYAGAKWSLGMRLPGTRDADIDRAFNEGKILRTHLLRPTWHFVSPADIRWMLELTGPRVHAINAFQYRKLNLDVALLARCGDIIARALEGDSFLTRAEIAQALVGAGVAAEGIRLGYILHWAELERLVCSGPRRGKQFTYALLEERAPLARSLPRDEALAELILRFFTSRGPAQMKDFSRWSSLTLSDAKNGLELVKSAIVPTEIDGVTYWHAAHQPAPARTIPPALLLPPYDELTLAYKDLGSMINPDHRPVTNRPIFNSILLIGGLVLGFWRRVEAHGTALIETAPLRPLSAGERADLITAVRQYGDFIGMPVQLAE